MPEKLKKILLLKMVPKKYRLFLRVILYLFVIITFASLFYSLRILDFFNNFVYRNPDGSYCLRQSEVKFDIPKTTENQKGSFVRIYLPKYFNYNNQPLITPMLAGDTFGQNKTILLSKNKILTFIAGKVLIIDFNKKIAYSDSSTEYHPYSYAEPVLSEDDKVYFFGGMYGNGEFKIYDSKTNKYYPATVIKPETRNITATLLPDNTILITGGFSPYKKSEAKIFDPRLNKYTRLPNMHATRAGHTATLLKNKKVLIVGDSIDEPYAELYNFKTAQFIPLKNNNKTRSLHTATLLPDGRVLIIGGTNIFLSSEGYSEYEKDDVPVKTYSDIEIFDPQTNSFKEVGQLKKPNWNHSTVLLDSNKVFITGGYGSCTKSEFPETLIYDLKTNKTEIISEYGYGLISATKLPNGNVLIINNYNLFNINEMELYIP